MSTRAHDLSAHANRCNATNQQYHLYSESLHV